MKTKNCKIIKRTDIKVLLILNGEQSRGLRIMVRLHKKQLREKVKELLKEEKGKEAFNLIYSKAEVESYIPLGEKLKERPALTLVEDML